MSKVEQLEKEYDQAAEVLKRVESLKLKHPEHSSNLKKVLAYVNELEAQLDKRREEERKFLEGLPEKVQTRIEKDKAVLQLRKEVLEMLKPSE